MEIQCHDFLDMEKSVFNVLRTDEREIIERNYLCKLVKRGEVIFREGEHPVGLICLSNGKVKVYKEGIGGRDQIIRMAKPVGFIGYRALFAEERHKATAVAIEDSIICIIEKETLFEVMQKNSALTMNIIKAFATELGFTINRIVSLTQKHVRGRLAESLLFLADTYGYESDGRTLKIYLRREELASLSGMTTSNAIRTLSNFSDENIIALKGKNIKILDESGLKNISERG
jgi:CRP/FNR family transcriptional regulator, polysaccharide utilization system transcription regulator